MFFFVAKRVYVFLNSLKQVLNVCFKLNVLNMSAVLSKRNKTYRRCTLQTQGETNLKH